MTTRKGLIIGVAAGLLLSVSFGGANADHEHTRPYKGRMAGTFLGTRIDLNDDGVPANWSTLEVSGTLGKRTNQLVTESSAPFNGTRDCSWRELCMDSGIRVTQHASRCGTPWGVKPADNAPASASHTAEARANPAL